VRLWRPDLSEEVRELSGHKGPVDAVALSPDGKQIASGSQDRTVRLWDVQTGQMAVELTGYTDRVSHVAFAPDGASLATADADEQSVRVWDVKEHKLQSRLLHKGNLHGLAFSPDAQLLATVPQRDGGLAVWDQTNGQRLNITPGEATWAWAVAFAPDGNSVAVGDYAALKVWTVQR
jgi:WD40 repeat protein